MTAELKGIHAKTFQDLDVIKDVLKLDEEKIAELEKENAELRKDKKELCHAISEGGKACVYLNKQLTKAKEIIEELLDTQKCLDPYRDIFRDRILKAEQFISEVK